MRELLAAAQAGLLVSQAAERIVTCRAYASNLVSLVMHGSIKIRHALQIANACFDLF